ncbi:spore coat polysaccharide synthesis [Fictibacillus macauensis ZFHKF-1]|uniref:dTDP-4-dehydrorhamnose reductase n=1 Tax=Fictibacillus macauensis ZFHKF-1 TaxID=1196324 RepID=I8UCG5_9BACL|nr:dTDP-4-dehydrorhamnose reductase [Fictibacillus macauensis]EIT84615.1 spore coat polysaccharide synthesis [Fictibacillus macauensis ZFHKF-1]
MKIVLTGGGGQLAAAFQQETFPTVEWILLDRQALDVTDEGAVQNCLRTYRPDVVIHCAAYTRVEQAESDAHQAYSINGLGAYYVAKACQEVQAQFIYISTDYVFDGQKRTPYETSDRVRPLNVYGMSKWLGEELALAACARAKVVRTSWLYGHGKANFVNTMRASAIREEEVAVICEQWGSPTYAPDLVHAVMALIPCESGVYHFSNEGMCSWYDFAREIYRLSGAHSHLVQPKKMANYHSEAQRPSYSVLAKTKFQATTGCEPRGWQEALQAFFKKERHTDD